MVVVRITAAVVLLIATDAAAIPTVAALPKHMSGYKLLNPGLNALIRRPDFAQRFMETVQDRNTTAPVLVPLE